MDHCRESIIISMTTSYFIIRASRQKIPKFRPRRSAILTTRTVLSAKILIRLRGAARMPERYRRPL